MGLRVEAVVGRTVRREIEIGKGGGLQRQKGQEREDEKNNRNFSKYAKGGKNMLPYRSKPKPTPDHQKENRIVKENRV